MTWFPFELHPEYPPEGIPRSVLSAKYGEDHRDRVAGFLATRGLPYEVHPEIVSNTRNALRVAELARDRGLHPQFHARVMEALWAEARDVSEDSVLRELAADVGLDSEDVDDVLAGDAYWDRVRASTQQAVSFGAHAVPAFVIDRRLLVLGAQPDEVFEQAVAQLREPP